MASSEEQSKKLELSEGEGIIKFNNRNFRAHPIACARVMDALKYMFNGSSHLPCEGSSIPDKKLKMIVEAYSRPLRQGEKERRQPMKLKSAVNLLMSIRGIRIDRLKPWTLSSMFTFAYYLHKNRAKDDSWKVAHERMVDGDSKISLNHVSTVLNVIGDSFTEREVYNICKLLQKTAKAEMMVLLSHESWRLDECTEKDEESMNFFFKYHEMEQFIAVGIAEEFLLFDDEGTQLTHFPAKWLQSGVDCDEVAVETASDKGEQCTVTDEVTEREEIKVIDDEKTENTPDLGHEDENYQSEEDMDVEDAKTKVEDAIQNSQEDHHIKIDKDAPPEANIQMQPEIDTEANNNEEEDSTSSEFVESHESPPKRRRIESTSEPSTTSTTSRQTFEKYFNSESRSDAKFVFFDGRCIYAHAIVLENKSDGFAALIPKNASVITPGIVNIKDIEYEVMFEATRFIYTGRIKDFDKFAAPLLEPAKRFMLEDLKELCEQFMCQRLSVLNAIDSLILAEDYNLPTLKGQAQRIIAANMKQIVSLPEFETVVHKLPKIAIEIVRLL